MNTLQENKGKQQYRFFAFISYSSKDKAWGRKIQTKLERYRLPARLQKKYKDAPNRAYPIFRDDTDLAGFKVRSSLEQELDDSQYLIVICSPRSAASQWVNDEIQYFIDHGKESKILPLIVEGIPHSGDPKTECFPPALRNMKEDPLGVDVQALGWRRAYLRLVSTLLNVQYDELVMRDTRRRVRNGILEGMGAAVLAVVMGCMIWYNTEHSKYYNAYTYQYEVPVGIYELSKKDRAAMSDCYRITTLRGKVIRLETVNSLGVPVDPLLRTSMTDYPVLEFQYDGNGELASVLQKDATGMEVSRKRLTVNRETNEIAIDFRTPSNGLDAQTLSADMSGSLIGDQNQETKSEITCQRNTYDENGRLIRSLFQRDNLGTPACDSNGVYGKTFVYDSQGLVIRINNLDEKGELHNCRYGWAYEEFRYDEKGNPVFSQYYDAEGQKARREDGRSADRAEYDSNGNVIRWERLDESGEWIYGSDGFAMQTVQYDEKGLMTSVKYFGVDGSPVYNTYGYHEERYAYDASGRICGVSYYNTEGMPVYSPELSCASEQRVLDRDGRVLEQQYFDVQGNPTCDRESGAYRIRYAYDENGNHMKTEFLDAQGQLTMNKYGYAAWCATRDQEGRILRTECLDEDKNLIACRNGYAIFTYSYDVFGNTTGFRAFDEHEEPCYHADGYSYMEREYENGKLVSETYFDVDGSPMRIGGYHEIRWDYDEKGNNIRCSYFDTEGNLTIDKDGYAVWESQYDIYGNITQERWLDAQGQPVPDSESGAYSIRYTYDQRGQHIMTEYLDAQGNLTLGNDGYAVESFTRDHLGNILRTECLDEDKNLIACRNGYAILKYSYDSFGNRTGIWAFDEHGEPCYYADRYSYMEREYENGKRVSETYFDVDGSPMRINGYHEVRLDYDEMGNNIRYSYFDTEGNLTIDKDGYAVWESQYDIYGNITQKRWLDAQGQPVPDSESGAYSIRYTYDQRGQHIMTEFLDAQGKPLMSKYGYAVWNVVRDRQGHILQEEQLDAARNLIKRLFYDSQGKKIGEEILDKDGNLVRGEYENGEIVSSEQFDGDGNLVRYEWENGEIVSRKYFNRDGNPILINGCHETRVEYDEEGRIIRWTYYDLEGKLANYKGSYAIIENEYDNLGNCLETRYYTADHQLVNVQK